MTTTGSKTGLVFSIYTIGNIVGSFFCGPFTVFFPGAGRCRFVASFEG